MKKTLILLTALVFTVQSASACLDAKGRPVVGTKGEPMNCAGGVQEPVKAAKEARASHILVDSEDEAKNLKARIDKGESFAELAKKYSKCPSNTKGGDLGWFSKGQMVKEFETAAFNIPVNTVSQPIKTQFGWHLIKVYDRK